MLIFLDEYDTPMQEAYVSGYWDEIVSLFRIVFIKTFKINKYLERAIITSITGILIESTFSDLNHLQIITTSSRKYTTCFGFVEEEIKKVLKEYAISDSFEDVRCWYDGFKIGNVSDTYNPWTITNYLVNEKKTDDY